MDGSATPSKNPDGASKFLIDLPSKGLFSSSVISSNLGGMQVYVTDHDTSPPENQVIKTDQVNILIRSLLLKQQQKGGGPTSKGVVANEGSRKRAPERAADGRASAKRAASATQNGSRKEGSKSQIPENLQRLTVERLRALLKERGLSVKGKKEELIGRLRAATAAASGGLGTSSAVQ
ncbi:uncharacterized protein LOC112511632 isoform X2 [Cynara cardunculus var. scolymus]|uniref:uncharacterized protein LOC112511632 isoform X2 n=1 Tax=Cynara cardunculus var. scolymus TaxID=59895 RepID=UPI000D628920|nr:uncharacterized protein LOC112511632 isoform X2 [Cynara cardunculus var. scolymus]